MKQPELFLLILRSCQQLYGPTPSSNEVREEACVLLWLNLGRVGQTVSPVPTQLLLLLRLVLLVM